MSQHTDEPTRPEDALTDETYRSLCWGLNRLCLWGELDRAEDADPRLQADTATTVTVIFTQVAHRIDSNTS